MWNSIDILARISHVLALGAFALAVLTAAATAGRYFVDRRLGELKGAAAKQETERIDAQRAAAQEAMRQQLAAAETRVLEAKEQADGAARESEELRVAARPRSISADQRLSLERVLRPHPAAVIIASKLLDSESAAYGEQLAVAIGAAGWRTQHYRTSLVDFQGVAVSSITSKGEPLAGQDTLIAALQRAGVSLRTVPVPTGSVGGDLPEGTLLLVIGHK
jgi:hypothetical protein